MGYMPFFLSDRCTTHTPPRALFHRQAHGFTLLEVMVVVAIIAVLAAIAAPSFTPLIERWRVRQAVEGLQSTLYFARSEAIKRGGNIAIRKEPTGANGCPLASGTNSWDCGWFVFVDTNGNGAQDSGEELLQRFATPPNVEVTRTSGGASIKLNRWGLVDGAWLGFSLVPLNKNISDPAARGVCMSSGGRIRVITDPPCTSG
jgi:type IV fimbrial biogenesis protein FimT